jgi:hypothetical protein
MPYLIINALMYDDYAEGPDFGIVWVDDNLRQMLKRRNSFINKCPQDMGAESMFFCETNQSVWVRNYTEKEDVESHILYAMREDAWVLIDELPAGLKEVYDAGLDFTQETDIHIRHLPLIEFVQEVHYPDSFGEYFRLSGHMKHSNAEFGIDGVPLGIIYNGEPDKLEAFPRHPTE